MLINRILVPTDGSDPAKDAADIAIEIAQTMGATITALHVIDVSTARSPDLYEAVAPVMERDAQEALEYVRDRCQAAGVRFDSKVEGGHAAEVIVDLSKDYDLIVMSRHGRTGSGRFRLGTVAERVVTSASCMVLTVRRSQDLSISPLFERS